MTARASQPAPRPARTQIGSCSVRPGSGLDGSRLGLVYILGPRVASLAGRAANPPDDQEAYDDGHNAQEVVHGPAVVVGSLTGVPMTSTSPTFARQRTTVHDGSNSNLRMLNFGARGCA